ncbi:MAG: FkbM family methyltransferase [Acidobacteria bacterium]|nr:FkbM family methyltransferase [Acidobacteriota bacterium]
MAAWAKQFESPIIFDVGGNVGFIATQLALLLRPQNPQIFSFEPVPHTFQRLLKSVRLLGLDGLVHPVCCAISDESKLTRIQYSEYSTIYAQIYQEQPNLRVGSKSTWCNALTLDHVQASLQDMPCLLKVDVEGHEVSVLRGARSLLKSKIAPGVCFEFNPMTLSEAGKTTRELLNCFSDYSYFYIDDFEGQLRNLGEEVRDFSQIDWCCNIFAVPNNKEAHERWAISIDIAKEIIQQSTTG